jgi:hypothetical protein
MVLTPEGKETWEGDLTFGISHAGGIPNIHLENNDELQGVRKLA